MNWGATIFRGSRDFCALTVKARGVSERHPFFHLGGGSSNHSSFGQSILIVDEALQNSIPAEILSVDVEGPVQHVTARSDRHYPGATITRTFALVGRHILVVDRVVSDRPRVVDRHLMNAGQKISVPMEERQGSWTSKPDDVSAGVTYGGRVASHRRSVTDETWQEGDGRLTMLGVPGTELLVQPSGLLVRRARGRSTDFVAVFSPELDSLHSVPVTRAEGSTAEAVGVGVRLKDGTEFRAVVSYEPEGTHLRIGTWETKRQFDTDYRVVSGADKQ